MSKILSSLVLVLCLACATDALATTVQTSTPTEPVSQADSSSSTTTDSQATQADVATDGNAVPANPHDQDAPSIEQIAAPNDSVLSKANAELLVKNAELERQVNDLTTQVNVLTHERSGQLFLYGALTVLVTIGLCVLAGAVISMRGQRSRW